jgi:hypothetical protein
MSRYSTYVVAMVVVGLAATYGFQPGLRPYFWPAIAWSIFIMSAMVVLAVVGNILLVVYHMFTGYIPEEEWRYKELVPTCEGGCRPSSHGATRTSVEEWARSSLKNTTLDTIGNPDSVKH